MTRTTRYRGSVHNPVLADIAPNSGGASVVPTYAAAIWMPMIACELCAPKVVGVEWMIAG